LAGLAGFPACCTGADFLDATVFLVVTGVAVLRGATSLDATFLAGVTPDFFAGVGCAGVFRVTMMTP
jgi:hypothetical protein